MVQVKIEGRQLNLSHLDKVMYPEAGFSKGDVIGYYRAVAPIILPHLEGRPLTMKRYPDGVGRKFFFEKECPAHHPDWLKPISTGHGHRDAPINYCAINDLPSLIWVANLASLEIHVLLSREPELSVPTVMVFDLDPGEGADIIDCARTAFHLRDLLAELSLECFPKSSGGKGLHIYVPLNYPRTDFARTKLFAHSIALVLERRYPESVTSVMRKELRRGKVLIDWSQNDEHKTTVAAYSLRAFERPYVSTPLSWDELSSGVDGRAELVFEAGQVLERIAANGDLFHEVAVLRQELPEPLEP